MLLFPIPFFVRPGIGNEARSAWVKSHGSVLSRLPHLALLMDRELRSYLQKHLTHPGLINLLSDLLPDGTSAFFGLGYFRMFLDYYYPQGGIQAIPNILAEAIRGWGGEIRLHTRVERVLLADKRACGVQLADGEEVRAGYVIAASDLRQALTRLLPDDLLPARFERRLRQAAVSHSVFNLPVERFDLHG